MTDAERAEFRKRLASMKTVEERVAYRLEHQEQMHSRAKERGESRTFGLCQWFR
ncbi:MAG: hypothetical protein R3E77_05530 [Steroidobacteraceae bacterium]